MERGAEKGHAMRSSENSQGFRMVGVKCGREMENKDNRRALREINNVSVCNVAYPSKIFKGVTADDENVNSFVGRRPITRRFAASLAQSSEDCFQNVSTRVKSIVSGAQGRSQVVQDTSFAETGDAIDEEDDLTFLNDEALPMVEEPEEMEIEMEDLDAKLLEEIDIYDSKNPLAVVKYVNDIHSFYRETEELGCVSANYMSNQFDINERMRAILIDWLIEVHYKFELMEETLFLTVNLIDRFLAHQTIPRKKLQLVGVTAMLLACKYEEIMVPVIEDLIVISDRAYNREEVLQMVVKDHQTFSIMKLSGESLIVNTLQFNMSVPTAYVFMRRFLKAAQSDRQIELLSSYIIELCLVEYEMLKFRPSMLAAAAVYTAQCSLKGFKHWTRTTELCTKYSEVQLLECSKMMVDFHQKSGKGKLTGVHKKYSTFKFGCAAKSEPALFLLDMRN